jgi:hypothetical protein
MPTLINQDPDQYDLDYFLAKYGDRFGAMAKENNLQQIKPIQFAVHPTKCNKKNKIHYFKAPHQPTVVQCLCKTYHTLFTSRHYQLPSRSATPPPTSGSATPIDITPNQFKKTKDTIPQSPVSKIPPFSFNYDNSSVATSSTVTDLAPNTVAIKAHTQHTHICIICHKSNIPCVFLTNNKHSLDPTAKILCGYPTHPSCISNLKLKPSIQTKSFNQQQRSAFFTTKFALTKKEEKIQIFKEFLQLLKKKRSTQQKIKIPQQTKENLLDWAQKYPITTEMEPFTNFNTPLSQQIFDFLKPHLINFAPGKITKPATESEQASKWSFKYFIKTLAGAQPKFLTDIIYQHNPTIDNSITIPFDILHSTLKILLHKFTTTLFTKLNYAKILSLHKSIPPYTLQNRFQVAINLARIHLYLQNEYQTIDLAKFSKTVNILPIRFSLHYFISEDAINQPLFKIQNDEKYNINISLNIPKQDFQQTFRIPSLKKYRSDLESWFKPFFANYKKQFTNINETKTFNYIKYEIATKLAESCKRLLPSDFKITSIDSLRE